MLSKLFNGELSLAATFWKWGVLGLVVLKLCVRTFGSLLGTYLQGDSIYKYFFYRFNFITSSKLSILWTLCYVSSLLILAAYSWNIVFAVWRSSASYNKSGILRFFARLGIVGMVALIWYTVLLRAFV